MDGGEQPMNCPIDRKSGLRRVITFISITGAGTGACAALRYLRWGRGGDGS